MKNWRSEKKNLIHVAKEPQLHKYTYILLLTVWSVPLQAGAWLSFSCECCVLSGTGLWDVPIPRPEESYRVCVCVCVRASLSAIRCKKNLLSVQWIGGGSQTNRGRKEGRKEGRKKEIKNEW